MPALETYVRCGRPLSVSAAGGFVCYFPPRRSLLHRCWQQRNYSTANTVRSENDVPVIFSGIQPTGVPHLGNYLGAMRQWRQLQDGAPEGTRLYFSIVDLHAITMPQHGSVLMQRKREMLASLIAIGLDPTKSTLFYQSSVCSRPTSKLNM